MLLIYFNLPHLKLQLSEESEVKFKYGNDEILQNYKGKTGFLINVKCWVDQVTVRQMIYIFNSAGLISKFFDFGFVPKKKYDFNFDQFSRIMNFRF